MNAGCETLARATSSSRIVEPMLRASSFGTFEGSGGGGAGWLAAACALSDKAHSCIRSHLRRSSTREKDGYWESGPSCVCGASGGDLCPCTFDVCLDGSAAMIPS